MVKIRALNESGSSDIDENTCDIGQQQFRAETQEENLQSLYSKYLNCIQNKQTDEAKYLLINLYELLQELNLEDASPVQRKLHFLTLKNLGDLYPDRIDFYVAALALDEKDVILWIKTAKRAFITCFDYVLCRNCLMKSLQLSPKNWVALDLLIDCLYILGDNGQCMAQCMYALSLDSSYFKALVLANHLSNTCLYLKRKYTTELNKYINQSFLKRESEHSDAILNKLNKLKADKYVRAENSDEEMETDDQVCSDRITRITTKTWNLSGSSMAQIGEQLIRFYSQERYDEDILQTNFELIWDGQPDLEQLDFVNNNKLDQNERNLKRCDEDKSKANQSHQEQDKSCSVDMKETSQSSKSNQSHRSKEEPFPYEFVDKRRSSRVQKIQNKTREGQDKSVFDKIAEIFNACSCFGDKSSSSNPCGSVDASNNQTNSQGSDSQSNQKHSELKITRQFFINYSKKSQNARLLPLLSLYMDTVISNLDKIAAPLVFRDIYRAYRHHKIPFEIDTIKWNVNFGDIDFWSTLCSLELHYNRVDWFFLWNLLSSHLCQLDDVEKLSARIRLMFTRGVYETRIEYLEASLELFGQTNGDKLNISTATHSSLTRSLIKGQIDAQSLHNLNLYLENKEFDKLFKLISPDMQLSDQDIDVICKAFIQAQEYERGVNFFINYKCDKFNELQLQTLLTCVQNHGSNIPMKLIRKIINHCKEPPNCLTLPWTILLTILIMNTDHVADAHIVKYIELAHEYLGCKSKCSASEGQFLILCLDYLINYCTEMEDDLVLQCFHCLFGYNRRGYSFVSHCNQHIKMNWKSAEYVYSYFTPEQLPEFDTLSKNASVNAEVKDLLKEMINLMPSEMHPNQLMDALDQYLDKGIPFLPDRTNWQQNADKRALIMKNIFYFLADYYFKNKEFTEAIVYYKLDLCLNPNRFDSWAATALSMTKLIEEKILNDSVEYYQPKHLFLEASQTIRLFSSALALDKHNTTIWIEFGTFVYNIASYASKVKKTYQILEAHLKQQHIDIEMSINDLQAKRDEMLKLTKYCFESSLQTHPEEEMWLHYYLLGKVHEKQDILKALDYYDLADKHLYLSGASYPKKISYSPQSLSLEALEVHYRIHAAVLKCILRENKISIRRLARMKMHLLNALRSPFAKAVSKDDKSSKVMLNSLGEQFDLDHLNNLSNCSIEDLVRHTPQDVLCVVDDVVNVTCDRVSGKPNDIKITLVNLCLIAFKRCLSRFNNHYKSLYRLGHYFYNAGNLEMAKNIFMNCFEYNDLVTGNKCMINGLFYERKPNNFFNGIWRIPVDEVERSGNFSRHLFNCVQLLINLYIKDGDYNFLGLTLAVQLSRVPDVNKKYLRNIERTYLAQKAFEGVIELLKNQFTVVIDDGLRQKKLFETVRIFEKLVKMNIFVEESNLILDQCQKLLGFTNHSVTT